MPDSNISIDIVKRNRYVCNIFQHSTICRVAGERTVSLQPECLFPWRSPLRVLSCMIDNSFEIICVSEFVESNRAVRHAAQGEGFDSGGGGGPGLSKGGSVTKYKNKTTINLM